MEGRLNKKQTTKKSLVRNIEQNVSKEKNTLLKNSKASVGFRESSLQEGKYKTPELNSSLGILKRIKQTQAISHDKCLNIREKELSSAETDITKKLNFHFNDKVYKDLVALNINASENLPKTKSKLSTNKAMPSILKDIEPQLEDFYDDKPQIDMPIRSSAPNIKLAPVTQYNGKEFYEKMRFWDYHV